MDIDIALVMMALIGCYLIGSIPEAWLIARLATGKDLRHLGSGNLGVTNTALSVARWAGLLVFLLEIMKGVAAVYFVRTIGGSEYLLMAGVVATVAGARWSIWLRGAGGRANTCGVAALFLINWQIPIGFLLFWTPLRLVTRSSFKATRICLIIWPGIFLLVTGSWWYALFGAVLSLIYLQGQQRATDDHTIVKERWPSLLGFLSSPKRK